ncbi:DUF4136 domain-containing protein [Paraburkholderia sp. MPAMCS5]|nr:DUF4136 domain-containing protein [Paraburkholderia sp. MPAMCS5]
MKANFICAALAVASLAGCTGMHADVHTATPAAALPGERTYTIARMPTQDASAGRVPFDTALHDELASKGFTQTADQPAHYRLSVAYATRLASVGVRVGAGVGVDADECAVAACRDQRGASLPLFGGRAYRHSLTLRFFERASGREVYTVSAASSDRDADPLRAMPALVKSALAHFPFDAPADWRVKLRMDEARGVPDVISVTPLRTP